MRVQTYQREGNFVRPPHGIVSDGHLMLVLARVRPEFAGVLLDEYGEEEGCSECGTREFKLTRDTTPVNAWKKFGEYTSEPSVALTIGPAIQFGGPAVVLLREDGKLAYVRAELLAFARAFVDFDELRQHGGTTGAISLRTGGQSGGLLMPLRNSGCVGAGPDHTPIVLHTERPAMVLAEETK